jgi:hypothetical protein
MRFTKGETILLFSLIIAIAALIGVEVYQDAATGTYHYGNQSNPPWWYSADWWGVIINGVIAAFTLLLFIIGYCALIDTRKSMDADLDFRRGRMIHWHVSATTEYLTTINFSFRNIGQVAVLVSDVENTHILVDVDKTIDIPIWNEPCRPMLNPVEANGFAASVKLNDDRETKRFSSYDPQLTVDDVNHIIGGKKVFIFMGFIDYKTGGRYYRSFFSLKYLPKKRVFVKVQFDGFNDEITIKRSPNLQVVI